MNTLGKILIGVIIVVAAVDLVFAARLLQIRNSWTKQVEDLDKENETRATRLAALEHEFGDLNEKYDRAVLGWDMYWDGRRGSRGIQGNVLVAGIGTAHGVGIEVADGNEKRVLRSQIHAFRPLQDGRYRYVGPFRLASPAQQTESAWVPTFTPRRGEVDSWIEGNDWRFRSVVPAPYPNQLASYYSQLELTDTQLRQATAALEGTARPDGTRVGGKKQAIEAADNEINHYLQVLRGDPNAAGTGGLVAELEQTEEDRNEILAEIDRLRRDLKKTNDLIDELVGGNKKLAEQLKQAVGPASAANVAGR